MASYDFDFYVIGAGSGGVRAARIAGSLGARVGLCEERHLGGTCVNVGCVPKKLFVYGSHYRHDFEDAVAFGWRVPEPQLTFADLVANKDREIRRLNGIYEQLLQRANVTVHEGRGVLVDAHTVEVAGRRHTAANILIATGGRPRRPDIEGAEHVITSDEAFFLDELPRRVVVLGGGYIGVEFSGIFNGYGAEVTLADRGDLFLRGFDCDVRRFLHREMEKAGVAFHPEADIFRVEATEHGLVAHCRSGLEIPCDTVMAAIGRVPNADGLGLEQLGIERSPSGGIVVDDEFCTTVDGVYACGDVIERVQLTPVALAEGMLIARRLFGGATGELDYSNIPTAVFSQPPIGTVGLTEEAARAAHAHIDVYRSEFRELKHTLSGRDERTMVKLVVDRDTDRVLGCHMVGAGAGEILQGLAIAMRCGATKADFDATIGIHPTTAEEFVTLREPV